MAKNRQIILFDNWLKGINTQQKLVEKGFSKDLRNFECARGGALEKVRNIVSYPLPGDTPVAKAFTTLNDFCLFAGNSKIYLVCFGDVGANPKIQVHDGTSWQAVWTADDGYMPSTTTGVVFVPSFVGGIPCLRVYPQAPDPSPTTQAHFVLLRPLLIYEHEERGKFEAWTWETLSSMVSYYNILFNGTKTVSLWEMIDDPSEWSGTKITCSCGRLTPGDHAHLKPCISKNDNSTPTVVGCDAISYGAYRTNFLTDFAVGDIAGFDFFIPYGTPSTPLYFKGQWMARVTEIEDAVTMYVSSGVRRFISVVGSLPVQGGSDSGETYFFATPTSTMRTGWVSNLYRIRAADFVPSYDTPLSASLACLKGLPISDSTLLSAYFSADRIQTSDWLPAEVFGSSGYAGSEYIRYGVSHITLDGCHSNIAECSIALPRRFLFNPAGDTYKTTYGCRDRYEDGFTLLNNNQCPAALSGAAEEVRKRIKGVNIWRWGPADNKWMLLAYIPWIVDEGSVRNPLDNSKVFYDSVGALWQSHSIKGGLAYWTKGIVDAAQPLAASVFDATDGLEESDMGKEYAAKTATTQGRKIFIGNLAPVVASDSTTIPVWKDDEIRFSLFDKGSNFNVDDYLSVASGDPDQVVKIGFFGRQMIVAKKGQIFVVDILGSSEGSWKQVAQFKNGILSIEHFTVTPFGPIWISMDGVMFWNGEKLVNVTENLLDDFRTFYATYSATMCIGFDRLTNKVYVTEPSVGRAYVIALETGTITTAQALKAVFFRNDTLNRSIMKLAAGSGTLYYPEAKINELSSLHCLVGDKSMWESSEIDLVDLAGEGKLYRLYFYVTYKKNTVNAHSIKLGTSFDGASLVEVEVPTAESTAEQTTVFELDVWKRGRILTVSLSTNEGWSTSYFQYFRVWKVAATVRAVDVD